MVRPSGRQAGPGCARWCSYPPQRGSRCQQWQQQQQRRAAVAAAMADWVVAVAANVAVAEAEVVAVAVWAAGGWLKQLAVVVCSVV